MGIPSLFRWISEKYPKIITNAIEEIPKTFVSSSSGEEEEEAPVNVCIDSSQPNPNGIEIQNLYLDMNGIIHPCCHPEDKPAPASEDEMFIEIFKYIDRIFCMIRPRKLLYMAIDGVAPRAKMNQQRSRRFRSAQEEELKRKDEERIRLETGMALDRDLPRKEHFDSNCITPGTPFMEQLAICLRYYILDRLNNDPGWRGIQVILSDASVPGEGEHKIMDYIRRQKTLSTYDPNTTHVLYGLDADLIMLALATHEPHFYILREDVSVKRNKERACQICGQAGHDAFNCKGEKKEIVGKWDDQSKYNDVKPYLFVHISVLREYLEVEMRLFDAPFEWDLERAVDDWVFMCFFVGNDFLPHLPSLEIKEGAVELLISIWKSQARNWDGYLTNSGDIDLARVQSIMEELGNVEDITFKDRREGEEQRRVSRLERKKSNRARGMDEHGRLPKAIRNSESYIQEQMSGVETFSVKSGESRKRPLATESSAHVVKKATFSHQNPALAATTNKDAAKRLKMQLLGKLGKGKPEASPSGGFSMADFQKDEQVIVEIKDKSKEVEKEEEEEEILVEKVVPVAFSNEKEEDEEEEEILAKEIVPVTSKNENEEEEVMEAGDAPHVKEVAADSDDEAPHDDIRLWEDGWKARYYEKKFDVNVGDERFRKSVVTSYVEGLCWVLKYYYQGVQSWKWFYPFHYSPFASDFRGIADLEIVFDKSRPFKPIEQLMGVFPAASKQHIPEVFHPLMTDPESPILDFYPLDFPIDLNGKKYAWQGVALLPFIDADRLLKAMEPLYPRLTQGEKNRNIVGSDIILTSSSHSNFEYLCSIYRAPPIKNPVPLDPMKSDRISGTVFKDPNVTLPGSTHPSPLLEFKLDDLTNDGSISALYYLPSLPVNYKFQAILLAKTSPPICILDDNDKFVIRNALNVRGRGGSRGRGRGRGGAAHRMIRHGLALSKSSNQGGINEYNSYNRGDSFNQRSYSPRRDTNASRDSYPPANRSGEYASRSYDRSGRRDVNPASSYGERNSRESSYGERNSRESSYGNRTSRESSYGERNSRESSYGERNSRESSYGERNSRESSYGERNSRERHDSSRGGDGRRGGRGGYNGSSVAARYDSSYMGGGDYANYNRDGKYQGSGYVPSVSSAELNSSFYGSSARPSYPSRPPHQEQYNQPQRYQPYAMNYGGQQSHGGQYQQQYGAYPQQTPAYPGTGMNLPPSNQHPPANADSASLVANLLSMLPGGSRANTNGNGQNFPSQSHHGYR